MDSFSTYLTSLGTNVASNAIYDLIKSYCIASPQPTVEGLSQRLASMLNVEDANIAAQSIISFLAQNGDIRIANSVISSEQAVHMSSAPQTSLEFGNNSVSATPNSRIEAGHGASIVMQGGANVRQNEDGSINFCT